MLVETLWAVATLAAVAHLVWLFRWVRALGQRVLLPAPAQWPHVTVVVCAHNEADALPHCLESLANQRYKGEWSILVVDDRSTDATPNVLVQWAIRHPGRIHTLRIDETAPGWAPKKWALWQALQAAETDCVALTDADCTLPRFWLATLVHPLAVGRSLVLGVGRYASGPGVVNALVQFDTLLTGLQYIGAARLGWPYMGVGRSLAYRKSLWGAQNPFEGHQGTLSGDDDLLVQRYATAHNTVALTVAEAASESQPPRTLREWLRQKSRHALAGRHYKPAVLARLGAFFGLGLVALGLGAALPFVAHLTVLGPKATYLTLSNLGMYLVARWGLLAMANQTLRCPMAPIALPAMDVLHTLHTLLSPLRLLGKRNKW